MYNNVAEGAPLYNLLLTTLILFSTYSSLNMCPVRWCTLIYVDVCWCTWMYVDVRGVCWCTLRYEGYVEVRGSFKRTRWHLMIPPANWFDERGGWFKCEINHLTLQLEMCKPFWRSFWPDVIKCNFDKTPRLRCCCLRENRVICGKVFHGNWRRASFLSLNIRRRNSGQRCILDALSLSFRNYLHRRAVAINFEIIHFPRNLPILFLKSNKEKSFGFGVMSGKWGRVGGGSGGGGVVSAAAGGGEEVSVVMHGEKKTKFVLPPPPQETRTKLLTWPPSTAPTIANCNSS